MAASDSCSMSSQIIIKLSCFFLSRLFDFVYFMIFQKELTSTCPFALCMLLIHFPYLVPHIQQAHQSAPSDLQSTSNSPAGSAVKFTISAEGR